METRTIDKWQILENFLNSLKLSAMDENASLSENTILARRGDIAQLLSAFEDPFKLTARELRDWLLSFRGNGWNRATTYIRKINSMKIFYRFLLDEGLIEKDPAISLKYPRKPRDFRRKAFTSEQLFRVVKVAEAPCMSIRDRAVFFTLITSGLRSSELCSIRKENLNLKDKMIYIPKEDNKGRKVSKRVPFSDKAKTYLEQYISEDVFISSPYLFHREDGRRLSRQKVYFIVQDVIARAFPNGSEWSDALGGHILRHCVDKDVEILSETGWKKFDQLKINEGVFSYNLRKKRIELGPLTKVFVYKHAGPIYHLKNNYLDYLVTPEHNIPVKIKSRSNNWSLWSIESFLRKLDKRTAKHLLSGLSEGDLTIGEEKAGLLGWIMTDGHISKRGDATIQQSEIANLKNRKKITKLLKKSGLKYTIKLQKLKISNYSERPIRTIMFRILKSSADWICNWLEKDGRPKYSLLKLKNKELMMIYKNMMLANGSRGREFSNQDKKKIDFFRTMCTFLNFKTLLSGKEKKRTYISKSAEVNLRKGQIRKTRYSGIIWCPETLNGTFIARKNEKIFVTGNSFATLFLESGGDRTALQHILGYTSQREIEIYAGACTLSREFINREAQKVQRIFKKRHNL